MRKVLYNGHSGYNGDWLKIGHVYTVIGEHVSRYHTEYTLKEVPGTYNSVWFNAILPTYIATSDSVPVVGKRFTCSRYENGEFVNVSTITAYDVQTIGEDTYKVNSINAIYVVQVIH